MNAKLSHFSELSDFLSEKSSVCNYFLSLLDRFKFGQSLRKLRMKKENGASYWICSSTSFSSVSQSENPPVTPSSVFSINRKSQEQVLSFPYTPQDRLAQASLSHGEILLPHRKWEFHRWRYGEILHSWWYHDWEKRHYHERYQQSLWPCRSEECLWKQATSLSITDTKVLFEYISFIIVIRIVLMVICDNFIVQPCLFVRMVLVFCFR